MKSTIFLVLAAMFVAMPASAQWRQQVIGDKATFTFTDDFPMPHPLSYFTENAYRLDTGELCEAATVLWPCNTPEKLAQINAKFIVESDVHVVGTLAGYTIFDVLYRIGPRQNGTPTDVKWKSILIQTAPDQYIEIWHDQMSLGPITPSIIEMVGDVPVLGTQHFDGGKAHECNEAHWLIDSSGPHPLDFSDIRPAIRRVVPPGTGFLGACAELFLKEQLIRAQVQKTDAVWHGSCWVGIAYAHFRLDGARVIPTDVEFVPNSQ